MSQDDSRRAVRTEGAPIPLGSYSQGVASAGLLFVSGQVPVDPVTKAVPQDFTDQVRRTLDNVSAIAEAAGPGWPTPSVSAFSSPTSTTSRKWTLSIGSTSKIRSRRARPWG